MPFAASGIGMILVATLAVATWRRIARPPFGWLGVGAVLWAVAVALKLGFALLTNPLVFGFLKPRLSHPLLVAVGGLYVGAQSSFFEMGCTLGAVLIWRRLGRNARCAISVGIGTGAFEAILLGIAQAATVAALFAGLPGTEKIGDALRGQAATTPLLYLVPPVERVIAILAHASTRAVVLLGAAHRRPMMVLSGFLIFALLDGVAGAAHLSGKLGSISMWWVELAVLPCAIISVPILRWCWQRWPGADAEGSGGSVAARKLPHADPPLQTS